MRCPKCGADNPDYAIYCGSCSEELPEVSAIPAGPRTCPKCRRENPQGQKFCGDCGASLDLEPSEGPAFPDEDEEGPEPGWLEPGSISYSWMAFDWKLRWGMLGVLGILIGIVFIGVAFNTGDSDMFGFAVVFLILGAIGALVTWLNMRK